MPVYKLTSVFVSKILKIHFYHYPQSTLRILDGVEMRERWKARLDSQFYPCDLYSLVMQERWCCLGPLTVPLLLASSLCIPEDHALSEGAGVKLNSLEEE